MSISIYHVPRTLTNFISTSKRTIISDNNDTSMYASRQGYMPTQSSVSTDREVPHVPDDYMSMDYTKSFGAGYAAGRPPEEEATLRAPPPPVRTTPTLNRKKVPTRNPDSYQENQYPVSENFSTTPRQDYRDHDPEDEYLAMDGLRGENHNRPMTDGGYYPRDSAYQDPFIADYLTMEDFQQSNSGTFESSPEDNAKDLEDDLYWDPSLKPPPRPPRSPNTSFNRGNDRPVIPSRSRVADSSSILPVPPLPQLPSRKSSTTTTLPLPPATTLPLPPALNLPLPIPPRLSNNRGFHLIGLKITKTSAV